jgi:hypothetical protein
MAECNLPKVEVAGSSPVSRSPRNRTARGVLPEHVDIVPARALDCPR